MSLGIEKLERVATPSGKNPKRGPYWRCLCLRCGRTDYIATSGDINSGRIKSCGCYRNSPEFAELHIVHGHARTQQGHSKTRTWKIWAGIRKRCNNLAHPNYGGKGISYDPRWESFLLFLADMGECPEGYEIDRRESDKNYTKENCRWVPAFFNRRYKGSNITEELKNLW